jgi:hypothetical protein
MVWIPLWRNLTGQVTVWMQIWPEGVNGIEIKVEGFSHKLALLTASIVQQLVSLAVSQKPITEPPVMNMGDFMPAREEAAD